MTGQKEPDPALLQAALDDRAARPWRYYKFDTDQLKLGLDRLADENDRLRKEASEVAERVESAVKRMEAGAAWLPQEETAAHLRSYLRSALQAVATRLRGMQLPHRLFQ
jgi:hypothetical protein